VSGKGQKATCCKRRCVTAGSIKCRGFIKAGVVLKTDWATWSELVLVQRKFLANCESYMWEVWRGLAS